MIWLPQTERDALIYVTSDLQAAQSAFAVPRAGRKVPDNASSFVVDGESLVIVSIQGCLRAAGANVGFALNQSHGSGPTVTKLFQMSAAAAGTFPFEHHMYRPLTGATLVAGSVVLAARLTLTLEGAPAAGSWLQVALALNHDTARKGFRTAVGGNYAGA
jgi:hypothetical protein